MGVVEVRFLPGRLEDVTAPVGVEKIVQANAPPGVFPDHVETGLPEVDAKVAGDAQDIQTAAQGRDLLDDEQTGRSHHQPRQ